MESKVKEGEKEVVRGDVSGLSHKEPYVFLPVPNKAMSLGTSRLMSHQSILLPCSVARARILGWVCIYVKSVNDFPLSIP